MLDMKMNSGKFIIDDNNQVIVDGKTAEEIQENFDAVEENEDKKKPDLKIED